MNKLVKILLGAMVIASAAAAQVQPAWAIDVVSCEHVSKSLGGAAADRSAFTSHLTPDGRYVVYSSTATNLGLMVPPQNAYHTYIYDRQQQTTEMMSVNAGGQPAIRGGMPLGISDNGRYVFMYSDSPDMPGYPQSQPMENPSFVYVRDRQTGITTRVGDAEWLSVWPGEHSVSADGNLLAFQVVTHYGGPSDITTKSYIYNRSTNGTITLPNDAGSIQLSANGQYAAYKIGFQLYRYTIATGESIPIATDLSYFALSPDGSHMIGSAQTSLGWDVVYISLPANTRQLLYANSQGASSPGYAFDRLGKRVAIYAVSDEPLEVASKAIVMDVTNGDQVVVDTGLHKAPGVVLSADGSEILFSSFTRYSQQIDNHQVFVAKLQATDTVPPTITNLTVNPQLIFFAGNMNISALAGDAQSGIAGGEYSIDTDPGQGNGSPMTYTAATGKITATRAITPGLLSPGIHRIYVRAVDGAGNWSTILSKMFIYIGI